jgi:hypothetical protein
VDTDARSLQQSAGRAARRGGPANALFLVGDACDALHVLAGRVDDLRITLPWGSLLRWVLDGEREFALAVAGSL